MSTEVLQPGSQRDAELGTQGPDVEACVREAIASLGLGTDPSMNAGINKPLARSERLWAAVDGTKRELLDQVRRDAGGIEDAPVTLQGIQECYCEARLLRTSMFLRLVDVGGPVTAKGKARALYQAWCQAVDRETKLAQVLGLDRKSRVVRSLSDYIQKAEG